MWTVANRQSAEYVMSLIAELYCDQGDASNCGPSAPAA
jgi:hypothetical protein